MIERGGDDALCPQSPGAQLVHADAGGHRVVAGPDPVVGGRGDDDPDPARAARRDAGELPAHVRHGAAVRIYALYKQKKSQFIKMWDFRGRFNCENIILKSLCSCMNKSLVYCSRVLKRNVIFPQTSGKRLKTLKLTVQLSSLLSLEQKFHCRTEKDLGSPYFLKRNSSFNPLKIVEI